MSKLVELWNRAQLAANSPAVLTCLPISPALKSPPRRYCTGPEFDWLEAQVRDVSWWPNKTWGTARSDDQWSKEERAARRELQRPILTREKNNDFEEYMRQRDAKDLASLKSVAPPKNMTVEEYNRWRGSDPNIAAAHPYVRQQYPMSLYRNGKRVTVTDAHSHETMEKDGWKETP